jgi:hypothetical protein
MLISRNHSHSALTAAGALFLAVALLCLSMCSSALGAGSPATVTVRVQGLGGETLLAQTQVTTNTTPISIEGGGTCEGTSAGGAIYDATGGKWKVKQQSEGVELQGLEGLDLPEFNSKEPSGIYWAFWLEGKYAENGICSQPIASGQHIVMFPQCYATGPMCPSATAPDNFLTAVPAGTVANVGQQVSVTLGALNTGTALSETSLPEGDLLTDGAQTFAPTAAGVVDVSFSAPGLYTLQAHAPDSVASDPFTICVHNGNDGTCGTTVPAAKAEPASHPAPAPAPAADVAKIEGIKKGGHYRRHRGPRVLRGLVQVPAGGTLRDVRIGLERFRGRRRCQAFDGRRARLVRARCGVIRLFSVGSAESFSYLLSRALPAGRYVYEIEAVNDSGSATVPVPGVSRVVFYVK